MAIPNSSSVILRTRDVLVKLTNPSGSWNVVNQSEIRASVGGPISVEDAAGICVTMTLSTVTIWSVLY